MATERFSKAEFETALDNIFKTRGLTWVCDGYRARELRYHSLIRKGVSVEINSSVGVDGFADSTGSNSIRVWLADEEGRPLAKKEQEYVTRVAGWQARLGVTVLKTIASSKNLIESPSCPTCGGPMVERKRKSDGSLFWGCKKFPNCRGTRNIDSSSERKQYVQNRIEGLNGAPLEHDITPMPASLPVLSPNVVETAAQVAKTFTPSKYNLAIFDWVENKRGKRLVIKGTAGCGKTTTGVEICKRLPSDEQVVFVSFNTHTVAKLRNIVPSNVDARTYNSLGYAAVRQAYKNVILDEDKVRHILENLLDKYMYRGIFPTIEKLVGLVKANLVEPTHEELAKLCDHHGIEVNGDEDMIFDTVVIALERCRKMTTVVDYDDQCWLPIINNLPMKQYSKILIDELQDTNRCQIQLALRSVSKDGEIIGIGDENQSIYGFRGADIDAMENVTSILKSDVLPLSISYRNPKSHCDLVNITFPEIAHEPAEWAKEGTILHVSENEALNGYKPGDLILCRTNAPLVEPAFALIRRGIKAVIRGRDIGKGLTVLIRKFKAVDMSDLMVKMSEYRSVEVAKLEAADKGNQAQALIDKVDTIIALSDGLTSITELEDRIESIFSDNNEGVVFSSVHKAKGLEAETVWLLHPEQMPHPSARKNWEKIQERHIKFVAYTRSLDTLVFIDK